MFRISNRVKSIVAMLIAVTLVLTACGGGGGGSSSAPAVTLQSIAVTPATPSIAAGTSQQFIATGTYSDATTKVITTSVTWTSSATSKATVVSNTGLATGLVAGNAVISATSGTIVGNAAITVSAATLVSIAVTPVNPQRIVNATQQFIATGTYTDATTQVITSSVAWSSGTTANATVSTVGLATGVASGSSNITALSGTISGSSTLTVTVPPAGSFTIASLSGDPLAVQQWHLKNTGQKAYADTAGVAGMDINVEPVYLNLALIGTGVTVAVVDTGLEIAHEDLAANVVSGGSWNFIVSTTTPTDPTNTVDTTGDHGTMVSGIIAMAKNTVGGIGVAPGASLKGFNALSGAGYVADYVAALGGSSASPNSSDVAIFNQSFGTGNTTPYSMNPTIEAQYLSGVTILRSGKGALYVKSAGNGFSGFGSPAATCTYANTLGTSCQNASFDPSNTLPYNIVVGAVRATGIKASYSTAGSAIWVSAPGGQYGGNVASVGNLTPTTIYEPAIITTDQSGCTVGEARTTNATLTAGVYSVFNGNTGNVGVTPAAPNANCNYTNGMNGTSSAAPVTSGVIALILNANPALTWRDVKHILASTSRQLDASIAAVTVALSNGTYTAEQGWVTNNAGYKFHNWYGFGMVNADDAVTAAKAYVAGSLGTFGDTGWISSGAISLAIPDNSITGTAGTGSSLTVPARTVEAVQIKVSITHAYTGDLGIELTSPKGTKSILKNIRDGFASNPNLSNMVLESNAFYGEAAAGIWTIKVVDGAPPDVGTLTNWQIRVYGH